ncbi:putative metal-nicotianamine transporter YSL12 [Canna indica]|uniref:Metal-nicotianamine transporter YSL12 n=1 Tax=Canna indica TaxID=4628 RepID=A0AAQ3KJI3_9LILI|nr:putative metal-nicotianamine transporter YSL12 [Canna indica]
MASQGNAAVEEEVEMTSTGSNEENVKRRNGGNDEAEEVVSVERTFDGVRVPSWTEQLTVRALVVSFFLSVMFCVIVMKLNLTTGVIPSLNVAASLLGFVFVKLLTEALEHTGLLRTPFTRQENTVIRTCVVAAYGLAFSGGFGTYLFGMSSSVSSQTTELNDADNIKDPKLGWMIGFMFIVSFLGLFSLVPLRKKMIIDYKLMYLSGTATAYMINWFHTAQGEKLAKKQVWLSGKCFIGSFLWGFFQWFYTGGDGCGFATFPILGLEAYEHNFFFDFSPTFVGVGMICPHLVNISALLGGIISWGIMWPLIENQKGNWFPADISADSLHGLRGYKLFIAIAIVLGDGVYNFIKVISRASVSFIAAYGKHPTSTIPISDDGQPDIDPCVKLYDDDNEKRTEIFLKDQIPQWVAYAGYVVVAIISIITLPHIFPPLKWYYVLVTSIFAPVLAFCNAYDCGLTGLSLASNYGKLAIFVIGAWAGSSDGGVLAALAACGVIISIVSTASDLMQDFKTGYLTLASPRSMFVSRVFGTSIGCVIGPCLFWLFFNAFEDVGVYGSKYSAPYSMIYRNMAVLGVQGFGSLPKHCLTLSCIFFALAIVVNLIRDMVGKKVARFIPIPMAMVIPFYIGPHFAMDTVLGSLIVFVWEKVNKREADSFGPAVASGMICGDGMWMLPQAFLALARVKPPICMKFLSRQMNEKVDAYMADL